MLWLFRKLFERLVAKLMLVAAAKLDSEMEIELGYCRAEMLRVAYELEENSGGQNEMIAKTLRRNAERLGQDGKGPASEVVELIEGLRKENLHERTVGDRPLALGAPQSGALPSPAPKKRGRPRKNPEVTSGSESAES